MLTEWLRRFAPTAGTNIQTPLAIFMAALSCPHLPGLPASILLALLAVTGVAETHLQMLHCLDLVQEAVGHRETVTHFLSFLLKSVSEKLLLENVNIADAREQA